MFTWPSFVNFVFYISPQEEVHWRHVGKFNWPMKIGMYSNLFALKHTVKIICDPNIEINRNSSCWNHSTDLSFSYVSSTYVLISVLLEVQIMICFQIFTEKLHNLDSDLSTIESLVLIQRLLNKKNGLISNHNKPQSRHSKSDMML